MPGNSPILGGGGIHHLAVRTHDFDGSMAFYTGVLGLVRKVQFEIDGNRFAWLDAGRGEYLELVESAQPVTAGGDHDTLWHFCLATTEIEQVVQAVEQAGMEITVPIKEVALENVANDPPTPMPVKIAFFRGPSGELVELLQEG